LVTCGGVSVGETDLVKESFEKLGGDLDFWKVAMRPGKPFVYGRWQNKYWFGVPGNPVSALVTFQLLVRPALLRMQGCSRIDLPSVLGILAEPVRNKGDRRHFVRVRWEEDGAVRSAGIQASHMMHSLASANGLVDVPPRTLLDTGTQVKVLLFQENG
jgi:molybdopterin molybdotransferase